MIENLKIDNEVLKDIINDIYYPKHPYLFDEIPIETLGNIYEKFLGRTIRVLPSGKVKLDDKKTNVIKKGKGIYYTPEYIVKIIIDSTVYKKINGLSPEKITEIKIIDPACGSGSFLLSAYNCLLQYHLDYYTKNNIEKNIKSGKLYKFGDKYKLTIQEKRNILLNNIYGVDLDDSAIEVTRLSLMLKLIEGENQESINNLFKYSHLQPLPNLKSNIICGNSLIESNFYKKVSINDIVVKTLDWTSAFPFLLTANGFDCVIGNPPWVSLSGKFGNDVLTKEELEYMQTRYKANTYMPNYYDFFIRKGIEITKPNGIFSFIVPDRFGFNDQFIELRKNVVNDWMINKIIYRIEFPGITADVMIFVLNNKKNNNYEFEIGERGNPLLKHIDLIKSDSKFKFLYESKINTLDLLNKIHDPLNTEPIKNVFNITSGFGGKSDLITKKRDNEQQIKVYKGENVKKYQITGKFYFEFKKANITGRTTNIKKLGAKQKILMPKTGFPIYAAYDETGIYPEQSVYFFFNKNNAIPYNFYLGILNSKLFRFYYWNRIVTNKDSTPQSKSQDLEQFPIPKMNLFEGKKELIDDFVDIVNKCIDIYSKSGISEDIKNSIDKEIDKRVYALYNITDENDINLIEEEIK